MRLCAMQSGFVATVHRPPRLASILIPLPFPTLKIGEGPALPPEKRDLTFDAKLSRCPGLFRWPIFHGGKVSLFSFRSPCLRYEKCQSQGLPYLLGGYVRGDFFPLLNSKEVGRKKRSGELKQMSEREELKRGGVKEKEEVFLCRDKLSAELTLPEARKLREKEREGE